MGRLVYLNGDFLPEDRASVSIFDRGLLYGDGLFETVRAYGGRLFRLDRHLERLADSARQIGLPPIGDLSGPANELLARNSLADAYLRITVTRGVGLGLEATETSPTVLIIARPLNLPPPETYARGYAVRIVPAEHARGAALPGLKSLCYLDKILARRRAREQGADEALLVNSAGALTEAAASNVFLVLGGRLVTPALDQGVLPGITRDAVIELARDVELSVEEEVVPAGLLRDAEECFLTNSIMEIMPVTRADDYLIGRGRPGPITAQLRQAYAELVRRELGLAGREAT